MVEQMRNASTEIRFPIIHDGQQLGSIMEYQSVAPSDPFLQPFSSGKLSETQLVSVREGFHGEISSPRGKTETETQKKTTEDLFSLYEKIGTSYEDLTFKDFCTEAPAAAAAAAEKSRKEEKSRITDAIDISVDFTEGLAAIQRALLLHDLAGSKTETEGERSRSSSLKGREQIHTRESSKEEELLEDVLAREKNSEHRASGRSKVGQEESSPRMIGCMNGEVLAAGKLSGGAPHTNYCCICNKYVLVFKIRCLVCGKCYCSQCAKVGMGSMSEGRKCRSCLGRRFSERYIERAGKSWFGISNTARKAELKWAKKGAKKGRSKKGMEALGFGRSHIIKSNTNGVGKGYPGHATPTRSSSSSSFLRRGYFGLPSPIRSPIRGSPTRSPTKPTSYHLEGGMPHMEGGASPPPPLSPLNHKEGGMPPPKSLQSLLLSDA